MLKINKKIISLFLSLFIISGVFYPLSQLTVSGATEPITDFWVSFSSNANNSKTIDSVNWNKNSDNNYYLYLPSYADTNKLRVNFTATATVKINNTTLQNGIETDIFEPNSTYSVTCGDKTYTIKVMKSANVPAMHLTTESGNLNFIHANKENKESGNAKVITADGYIDVEQSLSSIKGRGNATWELAKKPYNIKFDKAQDLLGMGKAKGWCLIANYSDDSQVRNKATYDMATAAGIEFCSDSRHVDLYINNDFMGTYLVTEKVDVGETSVDISDLEKATENVNTADLDSYSKGGTTSGWTPGTQKYYNIPNDPEDITGGYLLEFELNDRYPNEASGFVTTRGQCVVLKKPEYASKKQVEYISNYFQKIEDILYTAGALDDAGKHFSEYIDIESFAKMYLLQEFGANLDVAITSFFVYKDSDKNGDGKLHAAPAWDFDNAYGGSTGRYNYDLTDPRVNWTENSIIYNSDNVPHMMNRLYNKSDMTLKDEIVYQWFNHYRSMVKSFLISSNDNSIYKLRDYITSSVNMDRSRWNKSGTFNQRFNVVSNFMTQRNLYFNEKFSGMNNANGFIVSGLEDQIYKGVAITPQVVVKDYNSNTLKKGVDYTVSYKDNNAVGVGKVTITGISKYSRSREYKFNIVNPDISDATVNSLGNYTYSGKAITPQITLTSNDFSLTPSNYTIKYENNINVGTARAVITAVAPYTGTKIVTFNITPRKITSANFGKTKNKVYNGKAQTQNLKLTDNGKMLIINKDYKLSYKNNKSMGKATVTVTGIGNYSGTKALSFTIAPKKVTGLKITKLSKKSVKVIFKKLSGVKNYIVIYSTSKSFKNSKSKKITNNKLNITKLKSKKKYYFKVCAVTSKIKGEFSITKNLKM